MSRFTLRRFLRNLTCIIGLLLDRDDGGPYLWPLNGFHWRFGTNSTYLPGRARCWPALATDDIRCAGVLVRTDHRAQFRDFRLSPDGIGLAIRAWQRSDKATLRTRIFALSPRIPPERPATLDSIMERFRPWSPLEPAAFLLLFLNVWTRGYQWSGWPSWNLDVA
jgi:hypothetical protein